MKNNVLNRRFFTHLCTAVACAGLLLGLPMRVWAAEMHQDIDMHGNSVTNAKYYGDGAGLTNLPVMTESDPVWESQKAKYATGTPVYVESDPVWTSASNLYLRTNTAASVYATGTPVYVESDPVWTSASNLYLRTNTAAAVYATGTPVYVESDPIWTSASNLYLLSTEAESGYARKSGTTFSGPVIHSSTLTINSADLILGVNVALGSNARAYSSTYGGVAVGAEATARYREAGVAVGYGADGDYNGIAIGAFSDGQYSNIAIGYAASAYSGYDRITIGRAITNRRNNSCAVRGTLYLDGGTGVVYRSTAGAGNWTAKAFTIDHPLDPENKVLRHYSVEGPDVWNMYAGNVQLVNGRAVVQLPDYYSALNLAGSEVYSLTAVGGFADLCVLQKAADNMFVIGGTVDVEVSWTVKALRNDPAVIEDLQQRPVEQYKSDVPSGDIYYQNLIGNTTVVSP